MAVLLHTDCHVPDSIECQSGGNAKIKRGNHDRPASLGSLFLQLSLHLLYMKWNSDVKAYIEFFRDGCPKHIRPLRCLDCKYEGLLHRHDQYERKVITLSGTYSNMLYRFRCPDCGKTHTLRPTFIGAHRQATWDVEQSVVEENEGGTPLAELAADFPPPAGPYSEKTFWRWKRKWCQWINDKQGRICKKVLDKIPNIVIPVGNDQPPSTKEWLRYLWHKWTEVFPGPTWIGFFHWMYRMV